MHYRVSCSGVPTPSRISQNSQITLRLAFYAVLTILLLLGTRTVCLANLAPGWTDSDIGAVAVSGSANYDNGTWYLTGAGTDICNYDQLHFAYTRISSDGTLIAQVQSLLNAPIGQAGLMFRDTLASGAIQVAVLASVNNGVTFQWRNAAGNGCSYQISVGAQNLGVPVWLKLVRAGNNFSGYYS